MALTVFPTIVFDAAGSDTAASGAGPATALSGSAANVTSGSATATITDAVDLSGVAQDGSAVLWVNTASGRQYSRISAITGSSGAWSLTLEDSVWTTSTNITWGIGGKRLTWDNADSRTLFQGDVKAGWKIQTNCNQALTSALTFPSVGDTTNGPVSIMGNTDNPRPVITLTANTIHLNFNGGIWCISNLAFQNTNATKTAARAVFLGFTMTIVIRDCVFGDATNQLQNAVKFGSASVTCDIVDSELKNCISDGLVIASGDTNCKVAIYGCNIHDNGGCGLNLIPAAASLLVHKSTIYKNASDNIALGGLVNQVHVSDNVIDGSTGGSGVNLGSSAHSQITITNNNITGNALYGIATTSTILDQLKSLIDYNCFGSGSATDGPANTSGAYNGITAGAHDQIGVSPNYVGRSSSPPNFANSSTSNVKAKGFPDSTRTIGGNTGGTTAHVDIGIQHSDPTGGGSGGTSILRSGIIQGVCAL